MINFSPLFCNLAIMIKEEHIGKKVSVRVPNGCLITETIEQNPKKYKLYRLMGLDIFEEKTKKKVDGSNKGSK